MTNTTNTGAAVLSDEEIFKIHDSTNPADGSQIIAFARAILAASPAPVTASQPVEAVSGFQTSTAERIASQVLSGLKLHGMLHDVSERGVRIIWYDIIRDVRSGLGGAVPVNFMGIDPLNIVKGASLPMIPDSWRFGFDVDGALNMRFCAMDEGQLVAWAAVKDRLATPTEAPVSQPILAKHAKSDDFSQSSVTGYAQFLAWAIWRDHYQAVSPDFEIMADTLGVLSQIDNMVSGWKSPINAPASGEITSQINAALGAAFPADPVSACRAQSAIQPFLPSLAPASGGEALEESQDFRVLRNELAIILGCEDGRTTEQKAASAIYWVMNHGSKVLAATKSGSVTAPTGEITNGKLWQIIEAADEQIAAEYKDFSVITELPKWAKEAYARAILGICGSVTAPAAEGDLGSLVLVPRIATQEMCDAARAIFASGGQVPLAKIFRAMVDAAPTIPATEPVKAATPANANCENCEHAQTINDDRDTFCYKQVKIVTEPCAEFKAVFPDEPVKAEAGQAGSVDDDHEFQVVLDAYINASIEHQQETGTYEAAHAAYKAVIAHIKAGIEAARQEGKVQVAKLFVMARHNQVMENKSVVPLPVPITPEELAALRRFDECAQDGDGYDVSNELMSRLAEIGLLRRKSGNFYETTDFGMHVLAGNFAATQPASGGVSEDAALIDYLQKQCAEPGGVILFQLDGKFAASGNGFVETGKSVREAIAAARAALNQKGGA